jgi:hypothetical protein
MEEEGSEFDDEEYEYEYIWMRRRTSRRHHQQPGFIIYFINEKII